MNDLHDDDSCACRKHLRAIWYVAKKPRRKGIKSAVLFSIPSLCIIFADI